MVVNLPARCGTTRLWAGGPRPAALAARVGRIEGDSGRPASPKLLTAVTAGTPSRCRPSWRRRCASGRESRKARTAVMTAVLTSLNRSMDGDEKSSGRGRRRGDPAHGQSRLTATVGLRPISSTGDDGVMVTVASPSGRGRAASPAARPRLFFYPVAASTPTRASSTRMAA